MARIRTVKPDFFEDEKLATELTRDERLFYIGLWCQADDSGRFRAHAVRLRGVLFPYEDDLDATDVERWLMTLASTGRIVLYEAGGERYGFLTKFEKHQRINRPSDPRHPAPEDGEIIDPSTNTHARFNEDSVSPQRGKGKGKGRGKGSSDSKESGGNAFGEAVPILREHFWQGEEPPRVKGKDPSDANSRRGTEASVFNQLAGEFGAEQLIEVLPLARGKGLLPDGPVSLRYLNSRRDLIRELLHEATKRDGPSPRDEAEIGELLGQVAP